MGGSCDWPLSGERAAMIAMATTAGMLTIMISYQGLRKVKSKKKVKIFIMNNVFSCLLVKTLYFGTLSLGNNSFVRSIKFIIISIRSIILYGELGLTFHVYILLGASLGCV